MSKHAAISHRVIRTPGDPGAVRLSVMIDSDHGRAVLHPTSTQLVQRQTVTAAIHDARRDPRIRLLSTPAMSEREAPAFLDAGFSVDTELVLLRRDLRSYSEQHTHSLRQPIRLVNLPSRIRRQAYQRLTDQMLRVDTAAFPIGEQFDQLSIEDALNATPHARIRVAVGPPHPQNGAPASSVGYVITGRAGRRAYLQRLAVHPDWQRRGIAAALCNDALRWAAQRGVHTIAVNTRPTNTSALHLYQALGFEALPERLLVLALEVE
jgi:ribosomal protein S18 acetylase RimI-like enzyme